MLKHLNIVKVSSVMIFGEAGIHNRPPVIYALISQEALACRMLLSHSIPAGITFIPAGITFIPTGITFIPAEITFSSLP